MLPKNFC